MKTSLKKLAITSLLAAIAMLLSTSCARTKMKTISASGSTEFTDAAMTEEEKNNLAIAEKKALDEKQGDEIISDFEASQELAQRIMYAVYEIKKDKEGRDYAKPRIEIIAKDHKKYVVDFSDTQIREDKSVVFTKNQAQLKNGTDSKKVELPLQLEVNNSLFGRSVLTLTEKTTDSKGAETFANVNILVIVGKAHAEISSKDETILKMKDAAIITRISQVYVYTNNAGKAELKKLLSPANRVAIDVRSKQDDSEIYSLVSVLENEGSNTLQVSRPTSLKNSLKLDMSILSVDTNATIDSTSLRLRAENPSNSQVSTVLLKLYAQDSLEDVIRNNIPKAAVEPKAQAPAAAAATSAAKAATDEVIEIPLVLPGQQAKK